MHNGLNRRSFMALTGSTGIGLSMAGFLPAIAQSQATGNGLAQVLANPPVSVRPHIRWWWPGGTVDPAQIAREVAEIANAGFGGFEIADVRDGITVPVDPTEFGWASPAWMNAVDTALEAAIEHGITPSITLGPHWPTGVPGIVPDDDAAAKELVHGIARVGSGERFTGPVPSPELEKPSGTMDVANENPPVTPQLLALQAFRIAEHDDDGLPVLDPDSRIDIPAPASGSDLDWTAPGDSEWVILSFWQRGTGQIQNMYGMNRTASMLADPVPYVLDIYGEAGCQALTDFWDANLLPEKTRDLLQRAGGTFFEDSLELSMSAPWTPDALDHFNLRKGYDLTPYLALLVSRQPTFTEMIMGGGRPQLFEIKGVEAERVRHDFDAMLSQMYVENRLQGLSEWAERLGMKFRVQAIGSEINAGLAAAYADVPEGDNSNDIHGWRKLAAGRDIGGKKILSDEAATFVGGMAHVADWGDALYMLQRDMVGGANQIVLHGFSHADAPGAVWPGFSAFGRAIGNDWGPRDPQWTMAPHFTAYLARMQTLLREGRGVADLAILGEPLVSQSVVHAGYTFQYPAMELFNLPQMAVKNGRLMPEGPSYRALVVNAVEAIDLDVARRLAEYASQGFPMIFVGGMPAHDRSWNGHAAADAEIAAIMQQLAASGNVRQVETQSDVAAALGALGVTSYLGLSTPHRLLALHRHAAGRNVFYLLNDSGEPTRQDLTIRLDGIPYSLDPASGVLSALPARRQPGGVTFEIDLAPNEPALIVVSDQPIPEANAPIAGDVGPNRASPENWVVEFDQWMPGDSPSSTLRTLERRSLSELVSWKELSGLEGMSGTATYRGEFEVEEAFSPASVLELGRIEGFATVSINGSPAAAVSPFSTEVPVGGLLKRGTNTVVVTVASSLNNQLVAAGVPDFEFKPPTPDDGEAPPPPPPPPEPEMETDPDLMDGPPKMMGMQPGAAPPGGKRQYRDYGLLGPVVIRY